MELSTMSYCIICVFALLINKVSLQAVNVVEGVTGGSVVLPCATSEIEHKLSDIIVHWIHNDRLHVCDIIQGTFSLQDQDLNFKNRVESFPTEYEKGNFSLKLNNLTHADAGEYWCYIIHLEEQVTLITQLIIKESTVHDEEQPTEENKNQARETHLWMILTPVFSFFILLCIVLCIIFIWKKKFKTNRSRLSPPKRTLPSKDVFHDDLELHERWTGSMRRSQQIAT
ncbi:uncharacterized protein [Misgurnus anguillicaudatus]|uniref:uncharacterized protein isoform X2 n=1 Tax=Misgurnus anguillicaudatus TaxID=75329 RepID=UPI003CCF95D7